MSALISFHGGRRGICDPPYLTGRGIPAAEASAAIVVTVSTTEGEGSWWYSSDLRTL